MKEQRLKIEEIIQKEFKKKKIGGIDQLEVDEFLNSVIDDYEYFIEKIIILKESNQKLRDENYKLKMLEMKNEGEKDKFQNEVNSIENHSPNKYNEEKIAQNSDFNLERLNTLEKEIASLKESIKTK